MRTLFVNPVRKKRRHKSKTRISHGMRRHAGHRRRRRNAGITPFVASLNKNPQLMANPRRRRHIRRRHANPLSSPKKTMTHLALNTGGALIGGGADYFALSKIENVWGRNLGRLAASLAAGFIPGHLGAATAGAVLQPAVKELLDHLMGPKTATEADLDQLSADLEAMLAE